MLYALGENPTDVMADLGHTQPALALAIYAQAMRRDPGEIERLRALVEGAKIRSADSPPAKRAARFGLTGRRQ